ncbi:MAG: lipid-A-disaccharide synthase [Deltaproteobacteria bacterium]|nr:lipid-A-disaccharide synthase [Deltaproteobacteria bacterium]
MEQTRNQCVMIIAGEASGEHHGAKVVAALRKRNPDLVFCGIGGAAMKAQGVRISVDAETLAVVGIVEIFSKAKILLNGLFTAKNLIKRQRPDLLLLIDFPGFNLHIAATAKKLGIPVLYYISPQIWAWRSGRVKKIKARVNHMAVIFPFEAKFYRRQNVPVTFVGHPLLDSSANMKIDATGRPASETVIGLLPGSRQAEVARLLPHMLGAARRLTRQISSVRFVLSQAPSVDKTMVADILAAHGSGISLTVETDGVQRVFSQSTLVVAASGTVTLEAALAAVPMVIVYKVKPVDYWLGRALIRVNHIGLANLIAEKEIAPELIQGAVTPENIAETVRKMLSDPADLAARRSALMKIRDDLGGAGASEQVAEIAVQLMNKR